MKISRDLVFLGYVLSFTVEDDAGAALRAAPKAPGDWNLFCTPNGRALYILQIDGVKQDERSPHGNKEAAKMFRTWSRRDPSQWWRMKTVSHSKDGTLWKWGYMLDIVYRSDKWAQHPTDYIHHFKGTPVAYADQKPGPHASPRCWGVLDTGGRILVTGRGIVG